MDWEENNPPTAIIHCLWLTFTGSKFVPLQLLSLSRMGFTATDSRKLFWLNQNLLHSVISLHSLFSLFNHENLKWNIQNKSSAVVSRSLRLAEKSINKYFIAVMEPVKQPVGKERTKKPCCAHAHARRSQPARIYSIVVAEPGDSLIWSCFLVDYCHFLGRIKIKLKKKKKRPTNDNVGTCHCN